MRKTLVMGILALALALAALAVAQTLEEPAVVFDDGEQPVAGQAALAALGRPPLKLGADLGSACICLCRQPGPPGAESWGYYQRSIVSGCQWSGRVCVVGGALGTLGACTDSPAPLAD